MADLSKRAFEVTTGRQLTLLVLPPILLSIVTALVALRFYGRRLGGHKIRSEDGFCFFGLVMGWAFVAMVFVMVYLAGEGLTEVLESHPHDKNVWKKFFLALSIFWATAAAAVQASCLLFYARLYAPWRMAQILCYTCASFIAAWWATTLITWLSACHPLPNLFSAAVGTTCPVDGRFTCALIGSLHTAFDVCVMAIPIPLIMSLRFSCSERQVLVLLFFFGTFCTMCAVMRMGCLIHASHVKHNDAVDVAWGIIIMESLEISFGLVCCTLPTLTPVRDHLIKRWWHKNRGTVELRSCTSHESTRSGLWQGPTGGRVKAFVTLGDCPIERVRDLGPNDIQVTKEYVVVP